MRADGFSSGKLGGGGPLKAGSAPGDQRETSENHRSTSVGQSGSCVKMGEKKDTKTRRASKTG